MYFSATSFFSGFSVLGFFCLLPNGDPAENPNTQTLQQLVPASGQSGSGVVGQLLHGVVCALDLEFVK
jgi:hypothetical protein